MRASTANRGTLLFSFTAVLGLLLAPPAAWADLPRIGVAPFAHEVPNVRTGLAQILAQQLQGNGRMRLVAPAAVAQHFSEAGSLDQAFSAGLGVPLQEKLSTEMDYLLLGRVTAFGLADKGKALDHSRDLNDLGRLLTGDNEVAQAVFELKLIDLRSGEERLSIDAEGIESKQGTRLRYISYGWLGTTDLTSDAFRRTTLGRASYKAIGSLLRQLYPLFPVTGSVLAVAGDSLVIDLDARSGVRTGDELVILSRESIINATGETVYTTERRVAGAQVVELKSGNCLCLLLDGVEQVQEGNLARPLHERWPVPEETEDSN